MPETFAINGVACAIDEAEGIVESWPAEGRQAIVHLRCAWADRARVLVGLLGSTTLTGTTFAQTLPMRYPDAPGIFCTSIGEIRGDGLVRDSRGWGAYRQCVIPATFSRPSWGEASLPKQDNLPPFCTVEGSAAPEVFSPPGGAFYMPDLGQMPVGETSVGVIRAHCEITVTRQRLPYPPLAACLFLEGTLNNEPIRFFDRIFPRGTLMFVGMTFEQEETSTSAEVDPVTQALTPNAQPTFTVKYKFLGNYQVEFNQFMGTDGEYHFLNSKPDGSGFPPFPYEDFNWFFQDNLDPPEPPEDEEVPTSDLPTEDHP